MSLKLIDRKAWCALYPTKKAWQVEETLLNQRARQELIHAYSVMENPTPMKTVFVGEDGHEHTQLTEEAKSLEAKLHSEIKWDFDCRPLFHIYQTKITPCLDLGKIDGCLQENTSYCSKNLGELLGDLYIERNIDDPVKNFLDWFKNHVNPSIITSSTDFLDSIEDDLDHSKWLDELYFRHVPVYFNVRYKEDDEYVNPLPFVSDPLSDMNYIRPFSSPTAYSLNPQSVRLLNALKLETDFFEAKVTFSYGKDNKKEVATFCFEKGNPSSVDWEDLFDCTNPFFDLSEDARSQLIPLFKQIVKG